MVQVAPEVVLAVRGVVDRVEQEGVPLSSRIHSDRDTVTSSRSVFATNQSHRFVSSNTSRASASGIRTVRMNRSTTARFSYAIALSYGVIELPSSSRGGSAQMS
jgi:hypothetical protein